MSIQKGACALHAAQLRLESHPQKLCNIYCFFSSANMVTRTPFIVRFMHTFPDFLILYPKIFESALLFEGSQTFLLVRAAYI